MEESKYTKSDVILFGIEAIGAAFIAVAELIKRL